MTDSPVNRSMPVLVAAACLAFLPAVAVDPPALPKVLFDEGHGQRFHARGQGPLDLSALAGLVSASGAEVRPHPIGVTPEVLARAKAFVVSGAFTPFSPEEVEAIAAWVGRGGGLAVMIHVEPSVRNLLHRFGVSVSNGVIREAEGVLGGDPLNFRATRLKPHALTNGVTGLSIYGAWALLPTMSGIEKVAETSQAAWVDLNGSRKFDEGDVRQAFAVAVAGAHGKGRIAVFGDDAMFQNQFLKRDNRRLAENLIHWLLAGGSGS